MDKNPDKHKQVLKTASDGLAPLPQNTGASKTQFSTFPTVRPAYFIAYGILGALTSISAVSIPLMLSRKGASASQIGTVMSSLNAGALLAPVWGHIADKTHAYRRLFSLGFLLMALSYSGFEFGNHFTEWVLNGFVQGTGVAATSTMASLLVVVSNQQSEWDTQIGSLQTCNTVGQVFGLALSGWLAPASSFFIALSLSIIATLFAFKVREPQSVSLTRSTAAFAPAAHLSRRTELILPSPFHHLDVPLVFEELFVLLATRFGIFLVGWFILTLTTSAFFSLYPVLMARVYGISPSTIASLYAIAVLLTLPLYSFVGRLAKRLGPATTLRIGILARACAYSALALLAFAPFSGATELVLISFTALQALWPLIGVSATDLSARLSDAGEGAGIGIFNGTSAIAGAIGALAGGICANKFGYWSVPLLSALGAAVCWLLTSKLLLQSDSNTMTN